jgi:TonB family protein
MRWTGYALSLGLGLMALICPCHVRSQEVAASRKVLSRVVPQYPELARSARIEGAVKVMVAVAPNGRPTSTKVVGGHPVLAKAAVDAIEKWKWVASPDESMELVEIHFHPE